MFNHTKFDPELETAESKMMFKDIYKCNENVNIPHESLGKSLNEYLNEKKVHKLKITPYEIKIPNISNVDAKRDSIGADAA